MSHYWPSRGSELSLASGTTQGREPPTRPPERSSATQEEAAACTTTSAGHSLPGEHTVLSEDLPRSGIPPGDSTTW